MEPINVSIFDMKGNLMHAEYVEINSHEQRDMILNDWPGFEKDTYGFVDIGMNNPDCFDGYLSLYKLKELTHNTVKPKVEFNIQIPFSNPLKGTSYGAFDTKQPSTNLEDEENQIANWVQVTNLDKEKSKYFTKKLYSSSGELLNEERVEIPPLGRQDMQAGHELEEEMESGVVEIVPMDADSPYLAQVFRYGADAPAGEVPDKFYFAIGSNLRAGDPSSQFLSVSTTYDAENLVVLSNVSDEASTVTVNLLESFDGGEVFTNEIELPARAQVKFLVNGVMADNSSGVMRIDSDGKSIIAESTSYYRDDDGRISSAFNSLGRNGTCRTQHLSYYTFWGQENLVRLAPAGECGIDTSLKIYGNDGSLLSETPLQMSSGESYELDLMTAGFLIPDFSYGTVEIGNNTSSPVSIFSESIKLKPGEGIFGLDMSATLPGR